MWQTEFACRSLGREVMAAELAEAFSGGNAGFALWAVTGDGGQAGMVFSVGVAVFEIDLMFHVPQVETILAEAGHN